MANAKRYVVGSPVELAIARIAQRSVSDFDRIEGGRVKVAKTIRRTVSYAPAENSRWFVVQVGQRKFTVAIEEVEE